FMTHRLMDESGRKKTNKPERQIIQTLKLKEINIISSVVYLEMFLLKWVSIYHSSVKNGCKWDAIITHV
ncbi:unnamed protein product, partial [Sphenostylis stenocarpa]